MHSAVSWKTGCSDASGIRALHEISERSADRSADCAWLQKTVHTSARPYPLFTSLRLHRILTMQAGSLEVAGKTHKLFHGCNVIARQSRNSDQHADRLQKMQSKYSQFDSITAVFLPGITLSSEHAIICECFRSSAVGALPASSVMLFVCHLFNWF